MKINKSIATKISKTLLLFSLFFVFGGAFAQGGGTLTLTVNSDNVSIGSEVEVTLLLNTLGLQRNAFTNFRLSWDESVFALDAGSVGVMNENDLTNTLYLEQIAFMNQVVNNENNS